MDGIESGEAQQERRMNMKCQNGQLREEGDSTLCLRIKKDRKMIWTEYLPFFILGAMLVGLLVVCI